MTLARSSDPDPPDLAATKRALRAVARKERSALAQAARAAVPAQLLERFDAALQPSPEAVVSGYWPSRDEIDPRPLMAALHRRGHTCALPAIAGAAAPLVFRRWAPGDALVRGAYDIPVPPDPASEVTPGVLLVPLLAFDRSGARLGYGGGFYDRTLEALRAAGPLLAVGLAYAGQAVERVPSDAADQRLDWIVTETEATRAGAS